MLVLLTIAFLVALFGVIRPFKGFERKHFGMAAAGLFVACLIATPSPDESEASQRAERIAPELASSAEPKPLIGSTSEKTEIIEQPRRVNLTGPQNNAMRSAQQYLSMTGFSRDGLIQQLSSDAGDGYSVSDATVAVDSLNADWNENAARSARQYLSMSGFSCRGLIEQLSSSAGDKYTVEQATYGARQAGAC